MKKTTCILLALALLSLGSANAQTGLRFGVKAGYSLALQYGISPADDTYTVETGKQERIFRRSTPVYSDYRIGRSSAGAFDAQKGSGQDVTINLPFNINIVSVYNLNYFEMPMSVKYRFFKIGEVAVYGGAGIALSLLLDGDYTITTTINAGGPPVVVPKSGDMAGLDTFDYSFVYGFGTDSNFSAGFFHRCPHDSGVEHSADA